MCKVSFTLSQTASSRSSEVFAKASRPEEIGAASGHVKVGLRNSCSLFQAQLISHQAKCAEVGSVMGNSAKEALQDADVHFNRMNVQLARQQRLLASMLPSKDTSEETNTQRPKPTDDTSPWDDLRGETDTGGIGAKNQWADDELPEGALRPKTLGVNDKLLEQMLGKKGAAQHKKARLLASRDASALQQSTPMPSREVVGKRKVEVDSDDEDGRAAAFKGRNFKKAKAEVKTEDVKAESTVNAERDSELDEVKSASAPTVVKREKPAAKAKPMSYLDELLSKKANKKSKKKIKEPIGT